jgi:sporulation integral membrane protein YlbJ
MKKTGVLLLSILIVLVGVGLLVDASTVADGVRRGLEICGGILIPALFPFMVLSCFLVGTDMARILSLPLAPVTTRMLRLPSHLGATVLLSLIGGYPVGAKMVANLLDRGEIDEVTARRMLCFCVNASPSFLISAVGIGMLMIRRVGVVLFIGQTLATLVIGAVVSWGQPLPKRRKEALTGSSGAFVPAVVDASSAMITMCAFAVLFSGLLSLLRGRGLSDALADVLHLDPAMVNVFFTGLFEVTGGSIAAAALGGERAVIALSFCCSWGGLSVIFQVISCFQHKKPQFWPFVFSRIVHGFVSAGIARILYRKFCADLPVWTTTTPPVLELDPPKAAAAFCLLAMCSILVLGTGKSNH